MTTNPTPQIVVEQRTGVHQTTFASRMRAKVLDRSKTYLVLWLLLLPTVLGLIVFSYFPKLDAFRYAFYHWNGSFLEEWAGLANFARALDDFRTGGQFATAFNLVMILFAASLVKMWPSIFAAIALHRIRNDRTRYIYQVLFVIPMVIPGLVWLLIWKSFFDPNVGLLNSFLNATGGMMVLNQLDYTMPAVASGLGPVRSVTDYIFGSPFGVLLFGGAMLLAGAGVRSIGRRWIGWALAFIVGFWLLQDVVRLVLLLAAAIAFAQALRVAFRNDLSERGLLINRIAGISFIGLGVILVALTMIWTQTLGEFDAGSPSWLGRAELVVPSIIFWGFPWVGTIGVLIYLAGLQNITNDVYEAADLDGVGPIRRIFSIELPLIMTQVRINLIFMTIGVLNDYGLVFILLGVGGGPGRRGDVPGLVMYREAFQNSNFGYACALGMILFVIILILTVVYQKYVRVEK